MTAHPPPIPSEQRPDKDPAPGTARSAKMQAKQGHPPASKDPKAGQSAAVAQNTRNQGYKQDR